MPDMDRVLSRHRFACWQRFDVWALCRRCSAFLFMVDLKSRKQLTAIFMPVPIWIAQILLIKNS